MSTRSANETSSFAAHFAEDAASQREGREAAARTLQAIRDNDLEEQAWELDALGYTVLKPEMVAVPEFIQEILGKVVGCAERRAGRTLEPGGHSLSENETPFGQVQLESGLLLEDPVFEQALMNEPVLALVTYLLGESCILSHLSTMLKGIGNDHLPLHTDQNQSGAPPPFPAFAQVANATWALTEYSPEAGSICFVPGSHKLCRPPTPQEATDLSLFVPVRAKAGSVIIWHGNTWHGSFRRTVPGYRASLLAYFVRHYLRPYEDLSDHVPQSVLDRNSERFATLLGRGTQAGQRDSAKAKATRTSLFA